MKMRCRLGVVAQPLGVERAAQLERAHPVQTVLSTAGRKHLLLIVRLRERLPPEGDADPVRPGRGGEADVLEPGVDPIECAALHLIVGLHVLFAADHRLVDDLVVERHHERVLVLHAVAPDMGGHVGDVDDVFAVGRQIDVGQDAAARAERQPGHVGELRAGAGAERPSLRPCVAPAHRLDGHLARGDHVLLDERRRHLQRRGDVVEPVGHVVGGQHFRGARTRPPADRARRSSIPCDSAGAAPRGRARARGRRPCRARSRARRPASRAMRRPAAWRQAAASRVRASCGRPFPSPLRAE